MSAAGGGSGIGGGRVPPRDMTITTTQPAGPAAPGQPGTAAVPGQPGTVQGGAAVAQGAVPGGVGQTGQAQAGQTAEGVGGRVSAEELAGLAKSKATAGAAHAEVPKDTYALKQQLGVVGPNSTTAGETDLDAELADKVFVHNGVANPYNGNTTPKLYAKLEGTKKFNQAVASTTAYLTNPTPTNQQAAVTNISNLQGPSATTNQGAVASINGQDPGTNIMETLFLVFRESIQETNEDKKYFLLKLQDFNEMGQQLSNYLSDLTTASEKLGVKAAHSDTKYPDKVMTDEPVTIKNFDLTTLGPPSASHPNGTLEVTSSSTQPLPRYSLDKELKKVETMQETVRNKRQMASTAFQNFDQKANQLYNLLSSVMKSMNEMRSGTVRNML